jgi:hypothetical protein
MPYVAKLVGSYEFLYPIDIAPPPRRPRHGPGCGYQFGKGRYANVACAEVRALNVARCTECPLTRCAQLKDKDVLENGGRNGKS